MCNQSPGVHQGYDYSRTDNPTRLAYERCVADLEGGRDGFAFASGMAAIATVLELLDSGAHIAQLRRPLRRHLPGSSRGFGGARRASISRYTHLPERGTLEAALRPDTRMIWVETPDQSAAQARRPHHGRRVARGHAASSRRGQYLCHALGPASLEHGFDLVVHSATKYLNGHSDIVGGVVVTATEALAERLAFLQNATGAIASPFDASSSLRGMKTLALRMERHGHNAAAIADWLERHPKVEKVHYPGLASHPQHALARRQMRGSAACSRRARRRAGGSQAVPRTLPSLHAGRESGRCREPHRAPATMTHAASRQDP